jgi:acyl-CoA synthetase (AMP-forming)/AMP-acid ligase II
MAEVAAPTSIESTARLNVADRLAYFAATMPDAIAVACPYGASPRNRREKRGNFGAVYATTTFAELDADASAIARGLLAWGVPPGTRLALLVRPGIEFITLVFAMLRAGMVIVLVDPGLGRKTLLHCLQEAKPEGFVAIPMVHAARVWWRSKFPRARWNVTVGRRWFWGGATLNELRTRGNSQSPVIGPFPATRADDPAAIIFTSGSTGPPKGVLYTHRMFDTQVSEIQSNYGIEPGGVDLACFPLFALFNAAMGVTTVLPEMDFSRPASADPAKLLAAANDWQVTQAFASPAVWRLIGNQCLRTREKISSLRQIFSCGAPVPAELLRSTLSCVAPGAQMHTPYGATECLPVATIEASEVLDETAERTDEGAGVCVGRKFESIEWRVVRITDEPIATISDAELLPQGEVGELVVRGPQASPRYVTCTEHNSIAKINDPRDDSHPWHRMGDVGYLDDTDRFWYCGRKSHRIELGDTTLFTECVEGIFNAHADVKRSALIEIGLPGDQIPVICILPKVPIRERNSPFHGWQPENIAGEVSRLGRNLVLTNRVKAAVFLPAFPVDVRHNSKILRELLHDWACAAIFDDMDLYPEGVMQKAMVSPDRAKTPPPFAKYS